MKKKWIRDTLFFGAQTKTWKIMRLSVFFLLLGLTQVWATSGYSQQTRLSLKMDNARLIEVLDEIENNSEFYFLFNQNMIDIERKIKIDVTKKSIENILAEIFSETDVNYLVKDRQIVLTTFNENASSSQQKNVGGKVVDGQGLPLPGVTVVVKGTTNGTVTNLDGEYSLSDIPDGGVLVFSFIGMKTIEIEVGNQTIVNATLTEDVVGLEEVIITGYTMERKKDIIGSVSVVDTDEMQKTNASTVGSQLQGRAAGVFVQSDGSPEGEPKVRIRGFGSFGGSEPLYIVDGVPADGVTFNNLNPNDVESIQVLKDAASASVYGARAASGVIIISTKKGRVGKAKFSAKAYTGVNYVSSNGFPELLNAQEYGEYWWKSYEGAGLDPVHSQYGSGAVPVIPEYIKAGPYGGAYLEELRVSDPAKFAELVDPSNYNFESNQIVKSADTDWYDELFNPAAITNIQLGVTGGSEAGTYALSLSYFDQDETSNEWASFSRYTVRANSIFNLSKSFKIGENLQVAYTETSGSGSGTYGRYMNPLLPVWDIEGNPVSGAVAGMGNARNPIGDRWRERFDKKYVFNVFGNVFAELTILKDLVAKTTFGVSYNSSNLWDLTQQTFEHAENTSVSTLARTMDYSTSWTWTNTLSYSRKLGDHTAKILLGSEAIRDYGDDIVATRVGYDINDDPNFVMLNTGLGTQSNSGGLTRQQLASVFGRLDYSYADKYLINATLRRDGSSKFGSNYRYGVFPAVGIGWRVSGENFMDGLTWLDDMKVRGSYGVIGNQTGLEAQNQYTRYSQSPISGYAMNGGNTIIPGYATDAIGNPNARWEKSISTNVGFDATFLGGKYTLSMEYYIKETEDLLVENQAPFTGSSAGQPNVNIGNMTNKGIDISASARGKIGELSYNVDANFGLYKNNVDKVLESDDSFLSGADDSDMGIITRTEKGYPISYIWGFQLDGFFETQSEVDAYAAQYLTPITPAVGRWRISDTNGDYIIDDNDKVQLGSPHPDFQVGFNIALKYKNFDLSTFIFWNQGGEIFNLMRRDLDMNKFQYNRSERMLYESWTPENSGSALLPKLDISDTETKMVASDYYVEDATFIRMKTLQLGYTFPSQTIRNIGIDALRIYVQAQNLFTILGGDKPFTGLDPDAALGGLDIAMGVMSTQNPTPKQIVIGLNLEF